MSSENTRAISEPIPAAMLARDAQRQARTRWSFWLSISTLWWREVRGFYRQRSRVIGALATPLIFWFLLGSGFGTSLRTSGTNSGYFEFFFPGTIALVVLFTAIFSNISIIEDRREGFLLSVLVAPVSRWALVSGKILGATTIGVLQGLVFLPLAVVMGLSVEIRNLPHVLAVLVVFSCGLTGLGFFFAWWLNSIQGFHSVMNVVLVPMWMLSGAVFPAEGASLWVRWVMALNPLTYGITALRRYLAPAGVTVLGPALGTCWLVLLGFSALTLAAAFYQANRSSPENLT